VSALAFRTARVGDASAPTLVLLPAAATRGEDFVREGFVDDFAAAGFDGTVLILDSPLDFFADELLAEFERTVLRVRPKVWVAGCSLGGMGALAVAEAYRNRVARVVAIAPWPGLRPVWSEVPAAGGVAAWATHQASTPFTDERRVWRWLGQGAPGVDVTVALADGDRFAEGQALLVAALRPEQVLHTGGAHDWSAWRTLWRAALSQRTPRWAGPHGAP
jgi:pimeloyl-ACP methyl ester carboxylesterase